MHSQLQQNICVVKREGHIVTESVVVMMSHLQVQQGSVSNVLQGEEGKSQQTCSNQITNLEY